MLRTQNMDMLCDLAYVLWLFRRRYDEVDLPDGLLVAADAVCSFNPIYGHGMTVAALEVAKLDELLAARQAAAGSSSQQAWLMGLSQEYQQAILPIIQRVWDLSVGEC